MPRKVSGSFSAAPLECHVGLRTYWPAGNGHAFACGIEPVCTSTKDRQANRTTCPVELGRIGKG